jgi:hypothetical protein
VKPVKEPPAPLPPILPARPHKKQAGAAPAGTLPPHKKLGTPASSASSSSTHLARGANIVPQPGAGAAARLLGPRRPQPRTARGARGKGGGESLPPGPQLPLELRLCPHLLGSGECRVINCQCAHSEASAAGAGHLVCMSGCTAVLLCSVCLWLHGRLHLLQSEHMLPLLLHPASRPATAQLCAARAA